MCAASKVAEAASAGNTQGLNNQQSGLAPIVTSLGKVGGGGYSSGALDTQSENNRLTGETNVLLRESNKHLLKIGRNGAPAAAFW